MTARLRARTCARSPAGADGGDVPHLQHHDLLGGAAARPDRHAARLGVTRGEMFALVVGEALRWARWGRCGHAGSAWCWPRACSASSRDDQRPVLRALGARGRGCTPGALVKAAALGLGATLAGRAGAGARGGAHRAARGAAALAPRGAGPRRGAARRARGPGAAPARAASCSSRGRRVRRASSGSSPCSWARRSLAPVARCCCCGLLERPLGARRPAGAHGRARCRAALSRTGVAIAALMIAVSVTIGVGMMVAQLPGGGGAVARGHAARRRLRRRRRASSAAAPDAALDRGLAERLRRHCPASRRSSTSRGGHRGEPARAGRTWWRWTSRPAGAPSFSMKQGRLERGLGRGRGRRGAGLRAVRLPPRLEPGPPACTCATDRGRTLPRRRRLLRLRLGAPGVVMMSRATYERHWTTARCRRSRCTRPRARTSTRWSPRCERAARRARRRRGWSCARTGRCARRRWRSSTAPSR